MAKASKSIQQNIDPRFEDVYHSLAATADMVFVMEAAARWAGDGAGEAAIGACTTQASVIFDRIIGIMDKLDRAMKGIPDEEVA